MFSFIPLADQEANADTQPALPIHPNHMESPRSHQPASLEAPNSINIAAASVLFHDPSLCASGVTRFEVRLAWICSSIEKKLDHTHIIAYDCPVEGKSLQKAASLAHSG